MARAHFSKAVIRRVSGAPADGTVAVYKTGTTTPLTQKVYTADTGITEHAQPFNFTNGLVEFFLDQPERVRLVITPSGSPAQTFDNIDVRAAANENTITAAAVDAVVQRFKGLTGQTADLGVWQVGDTLLSSIDRDGIPLFNFPAWAAADSGKEVGLRVGVKGAVGWRQFVVKGTTLWGDGIDGATGTPGEDVVGGSRYVTLGAGGPNGIMFRQPHVVWSQEAGMAEIRYGRMGGKNNGAWWYSGAGHARTNSTGTGGSFVVGIGGPGGATGDHPIMPLFTLEGRTGRGAFTRSVRAGQNSADAFTTISGVDLMLDLLMS